MEKLINAISSFFTDIFAYISGLVTYAISVITQAFQDLLTMLKDVFLWLLDKVLELIEVILGTLPAVDIPNFWGLLPIQAVNIAGLIGIGQAIGIIIAALIIRFLLQLIPFTRLGS
jgi:hypothetical protein